MACLLVVTTFTCAVHRRMEDFQHTIKKDSRETSSCAYYARYVTLRPRLKTTGQVGQHQTARISNPNVDSISTKVVFDSFILGRQMSVA